MFCISLRSVWCNLTIILIHFLTVTTPLQTIKIGGLFDIWDPIEETAFRHAAERLNADPNAFPKYSLGAVLEKVRPGDSYDASLKVCQLLKQKVGGIIGPQSPITANHVQSVSDVFNIPRIETKWDFRGSVGNDYLINLYPEPSILSKAYAEVIKDFGWSKVAIIYENNESLVRLKGIFELTTEVIKQYIVKQLPKPIGDEELDFRPLMKDLRTNFNDVTNIILDCQSSKLTKFFQDANSEMMLTHEHDYFITSLDIHILDTLDDTFAHVNITGFRLVDPDNTKLQAILESWCHRTNTNPTLCQEDPFLVSNLAYPYSQRVYPNLTNNMLTVDTALIYDAVELLALGLQQHVEAIEDYFPESLTCDATTIKPWSQGKYLINALKQVNFSGLSGDILIDEDGKRRNFSLEVMELTNRKVSKIGDWSMMLPNPNHLNWTREANETRLTRIAELRGLRLNITTKPNTPYVMFNDDGTVTGYAVDLIKLLAEEFHFNYSFYSVRDNSMGSKNNGSNYTHGWDGMVGEILDGKAQLAIADFSITAARAEMIDFSLPFMNIGISVLYKKRAKSAPNLFSFLDPFHYEVWIYMATAYLGVSLILFIIARITPYEWLNPHPCIESPEELELTLHLTNSLWFTIGTLMQQGSDIAPKAGSTRVVAGIWWFFTLILISSYTANLAAFLTSEGMEEGIKDIKDLPKQTKVKYGTLKSGSTYNFFMDSKFPLYAEIGTNMKAMSPPPFLGTTAEGVKKVNDSNGDFAFFMESASIEYAMQRECSLIQLGAPLDSKGFGIGFRKGSKFRNDFNIKLLELQQTMKLEELKQNWWVKDGGGLCKKETASTTGAQALTLGHVGGVFVVLLGGCIAAIIMVFFEFMWKARKLRSTEESSTWSAIWKELKFALQFHNETKPIKKCQSINLTIQSQSVPNLGFDGGVDQIDN